MDAQQGAKVATGFSAGVDTFATLLLHTGGDVPSTVRITDLAVFNVGSLGPTDKVAELHALFRKRCAAYAAKREFGTYFVSSNIDAFYASSAPRFQHAHTLRSAAAALLLQSEIGCYIYSAGMHYREIGARPFVDMCVLDPILLPLLSTERLTFLSGGAALSRGEKTALIAGEADAQAMLDVCVAPQAIRLGRPKLNCSECWKCARTLLTLEALGRLDDFAAVFDVPFYRAHRMALLGKLRVQADQGNLANLEALDMARARGLVVPQPGLLWRSVARLQRRLSVR